MLTNEVRRKLKAGQNTDSKTYFERANEEILRVVQIEDIAAVARIDEILSVPGGVAPGALTPGPEAAKRRLVEGG